MKNVKQCFNELVSLTQLFLLRENSLKDKQTVSPDTWAFFKKRASTGTPAQQSAPKNGFTPTAAPSSSTLPPRPPLPRQQATSHSPAPLPPADLMKSRSQVELSAPIAPTRPAAASPQQSTTPPTQSSTTEKGAGKRIALQPLDAPPVRDQGEFWKLFHAKFPSTPTSETIPCDAVARKIKNSWLAEQTIPPIIILSFNDEEKHLTFLKNIAKAISVRIAPARVLSADKLEKERQWEEILAVPDLKLIIANDYGLYLHPELMRHYQEKPQQGKHYLKNVPLLLLSDPTLYLQEPQLKLLLWRAICNECHSPSQNNPGTPSV